MGNKYFSGKGHNFLSEGVEGFKIKVQDCAKFSVSGKWGGKLFFHNFLPESAQISKIIEQNFAIFFIN